MSPCTKAHWQLLMRGLKASDPLVQADAARLLGELGDARAVGPLLGYVKTSGHNFKTAGLEALGRIGDRGAVPELRPLVDEPNVRDDWYWFNRRGVRAAAAVALLRLGDETGAAFLEGLSEKGDGVFFSWFAPSILRLPDETAAARSLKAKVTVAALCDESGPVTRVTDPAQVQMVAETLGLLGTPEACAKLLALLEFRSRYVRGQAAVSLLAADACPVHRDAVARQFREDPTDFVKIKAALALHRAGAKDGTASDLAGAATSLADWFDRAVAIEALGELADPAHAAVAEQGLAHEQPYVRLVAIEALEKMGGGDRTVAKLCRDPDARVRQQAAKYLLAQERSGRR